MQVENCYMCRKKLKAKVSVKGVGVAVVCLSCLQRAERDFLMSMGVLE